MVISPEKDPVLTEYGRHAPHYDRRWAFYVDATTQATLKRLGAHPGDRVLDVGCGTGALLKATAMAVPEAELVGVEPSPEMLRIAREKLGASVDLRQSRAENLPFPNEAFDIIVSTNVLHFLRRPLEVLHEMSRVLRPGGRVVITDWCDDYVMCKIFDLLLRLFNRAHFRTYGQRECHELLEHADFASIQIERYRINWLWGLMTAIGEKRTVRQRAGAKRSESASARDS